VFDSEDAYVAHLAARIFATPDGGEPASLASRVRQVRNPTLLGDVSPQAAAAALRESLPTVAEDVVVATAEALAESDATREAFALDKEAADLLADFKTVWCAHAVDVVRGSHGPAQEEAKAVRGLQDAVKSLTGKLKSAHNAADHAKKDLEQHGVTVAAIASEIEALQKHQAYKDAGRLSDLQNTLTAELRQAEAVGKAMTAVAHSAAEQGKSLRRELSNIIEDLDECRQEAVAADPAAAPVGVLLSWEDQARPSLVVGEFSADPGPVLFIRGGEQALLTTAKSWQERADEHALRADAAGVALIDYRQAEAARKQADDASKEAASAETRADNESANAHRAEITAASTARTLLSAVSSWTKEHPHLSEPSDGIQENPALELDVENPWTLDEVAALAEGEPGQVLAAADGWAGHALARAEQLAAGLRSDAERASEDAERLRAETGVMRGQATELRAGRLLPLPRPEWAGSGDDARAFGAVLDWSADLCGDKERALIEAAVAAAGLLGANLGPSGASTDVWRVEACGPVACPNLGQVVTVDPEHPLAESARAVLERIRVATSSSAPEADDMAEAALVIGLDGTFRAGVLRGIVPGADDPRLLPAASHIGARCHFSRG
jgi:hypothetical protein